MKTPSILIVLSIFVAYVVGFDYLKWEKGAQSQNQQDQLATFHTEALFGGTDTDTTSSTSTDFGDDLILTPLANWPDQARLNMFQYITNSGCYFYDNRPWFTFLNKYISAELRLQLSNFCAKYTNIVY